MNFRWKENPVSLQVLLGCLLLLFLATLSYVIFFVRPTVSGLELFARANSTRTSLALTSGALMGPFPTATGPTPTPSRTPSNTFTPTNTPSVTPSPTPVRYFINTATPRTLVPRTDLTSTLAPPVPTSIPPTEPPARPTSTSVPPTDPPTRPTRTPVPPTDPPTQPTQCVNPQDVPIPCPKKP
jgi:hypothetical protein